MLQAILFTTGVGMKFITLGDWGGMGLGGYQADTAMRVAKQLESTASHNNVQFVINTGDNFYYCGITNTSDPQVSTDFLQPYSGKSLQVPWYGVLGNHEYGYNVDAQISLTTKIPNWVIEDRYYTKRLPLADSGMHVSFIFIDTSPCVQDYRDSDASKWDPCGSMFPTCAPVMRGPCQFHENILTQDCSEQRDWFKRALDAVPEDDWLIVVGHHPADEIDVEDFASLLQDRGFDLYLNGHAHTLTQYSIDGNPAYVTSGAGSMIKTYDQEAHVTAVKVQGGNYTTASRDSARMEEAAPGVGQPTAVGRHSYDTVWNRKIAGFTLHTFSDDYSSLETKYVDYLGTEVHSFTVKKKDRRVGRGKRQQEPAAAAAQRQEEQLVESA